MPLSLLRASSSFRPRVFHTYYKLHQIDCTQPEASRGSGACIDALMYCFCSPPHNSGARRQGLGRTSPHRSARAAAYSGTLAGTAPQSNTEGSQSSTEGYGRSSRATADSTTTRRLARRLEIRLGVRWRNRRSACGWGSRRVAGRQRKARRQPCDSCCRPPRADVPLPPQIPPRFPPRLRRGGAVPAAGKEGGGGCLSLVPFSGRGGKWVAFRGALPTCRRSGRWAAFV